MCVPSARLSIIINEEIVVIIITTVNILHTARFVTQQTIINMTYNELSINYKYNVNAVLWFKNGM